MKYSFRKWLSQSGCFNVCTHLIYLCTTLSCIYKKYTSAQLGQQVRVLPKRFMWRKLLLSPTVSNNSHHLAPSIFFCFVSFFSSLLGVAGTKQSSLSSSLSHCSLSQIESINYLIRIECCAAVGNKTKNYTIRNPLSFSMKRRY